MIFNDGLPFKGFMDEETEFCSDPWWERPVSSDRSHQPLGGGSNGGDEQKDPVRDEVAELTEMNENLRKRHLKIITKMECVIEFLKIESKISNNLVVEFLESIVEDSVDIKEVNSKINKAKNPIERRLGNIED